MVTANIIQRILLVKYGKEVGTAFTIEVGEKQYLISAKHIFTNVNSDSSIEILKDGAFRKVKVSPVVCENKEIDIVAFALENDLTDTRKLPISTGINGAILSQDVYFLGYPYGLKHEINSSDGFPLPLVKKGIISALINPGTWFDGHNNPGFSGGPIVIKQANDSLQIISVVSGYQPDTKTGENSGIFFGYNIDNIIDSICKSSQKAK